MGKVQHFEIPVNNSDKAKEFYSKLFGWKIIDVSVGKMKYFMIQTGPTDKEGMVQDKGFINGGFTVNDPTAKTPVIVITVDDIEKTSLDIKKSGGKIIMEKQKVGDMGYYTRFKDPEGNLMGLWENIRKSE